jgi:putative oxidoreductase
MKKFFAVRNQNLWGSVALLLLRVVMGVAFMMHGWMKIQSPFNWMGPDSPVPGLFQFLGAFAEFGGGLALILGLLFPLACLGIFFTMLGAIYLHAIVMGDPFIGPKSFELATVYLLIAIVFITIGAGNFSLDRKLFGTKS